MSVRSIQNSRRLLAIDKAVDDRLLQQLENIDWLSQPYVMDPHGVGSLTFRRRLLCYPCDLQNAIDAAVAKLIPAINDLTNQQYSEICPCWQLCESGFECPIHTDGKKPNVMIVYWHTPGPEFGTTFYRSNDFADVWHEFAGLANTGFFANYEPDIGEAWPTMWHASLKSVPQGEYRLMTQYELRR